MKRRAPIWKTLVEEYLAKGMSHREVAVELGIPKGTVKTWSRRAKARTTKAGMKPAMKPGAANEMASEMKPGMKPEKLATFRGITALDLPGRTREIQSLNFAAFKQGRYPPRSAGIPGYLQGAELVEALEKWCGKWKGERKV
jgi:hypothetical protein